MLSLIFLLACTGTSLWSAESAPPVSAPIPSALKPYPSAFARPPVEFRLWEQGAPGNPEPLHKAWPGPNSLISRWGIPSIVVWTPLTNGTHRKAVMICPGGAYQALSIDWRNHVDGLLQDGFVVFMLKYRTVPDWKIVETNALLDAQRGIRFIRIYAAHWGIDPDRIGVAGASSGANLALNLITHPDAGRPADPDPVERAGCRVAFAALLCPWPTPANHPVSFYPIVRDSPPAFIATARDDEGAPTSWAVAIADAYAKAGAPYRLWQIEKGGHLAFHSKSTDGEGFQWRARFVAWLPEVMP